MREKLICIIILMLATVHYAKAFKQNSISIESLLDLTGLHNDHVRISDINSKIKELPKNVQRQIMDNGNRVLKINFTTSRSIDSSMYEDFAQSGLRVLYDEVNNNDLNNLKNLILAECLVNDGRYLSKIEEHCQRFIVRDSWVMPAHINKVKHGDLIDIGAVDISEILSWVIYLFDDKISEKTKSDIITLVNARIFEAYLKENMTWMGFSNDAAPNNWNPWCNYKVLLSVNLLNNYVDSVVKKNIVEKLINSVRNFVSRYSHDGYCDEGPVYWQHSILNLIKFTKLVEQFGYYNVVDHNFLQNATRYIINMYISGDYYVNFSDATPRVFFYPVDVYDAGTYLKAPDILAFAYYLSTRNKVDSNPIRGTITQSINTILTYSKLVGKSGNLQHENGYYYNNNQVAIARTYDNNKGFFFAAKGGNNAENHNHNDIGSFILYYQGLPVFIDLGAGTYTQQYFSNKRYSLMATSSDYHNVSKVNGFSQSHGAGFIAKNPEFRKDKSGVTFGVDIEQAYPKAAQISRYRRSFYLSQIKSELVITDDILFHKRNGKIETFFICLNKPTRKQVGVYVLTNISGTKLSFTFDSNLLNAKVESVSLKDLALEKSWGKGEIYRLVLSSKDHVATSRLKHKIVIKPL